MTKLTDVQKNYIENSEGLILKLRDELKESHSIMAEEWSKVRSIDDHLRYVLADFYEWLEEENLTANPLCVYPKDIVEARMKSWENLNWNSGTEVLKLLKSAIDQLMQRLDQISNELNERECDVPDCG